LTGDLEFALLPLAGLAAGLVAVPFGLIALRVRRHVVVVTIAIFFIFQLMAYNFRFTGGSVGIPAPFLTWAPETITILLLPGARPRGRDALLSG
jgi:ABC-type branched-subunit amino acid transport system permease subunit